MQWFHSGIGSAWYIAHILTELFIWLMIWEVLSKKRLFIIGLLIGAAYWSRLPAILAVIFPLTYLSQEFFYLQHHRRSVNIKNLLLMGLGIAPFLIANVLYNYLRFGVIYDIAYSMLPVFHEPWYRYGLFNIRYIPVHLQEIFTALPRLQPKFPFLIPSKSVLALWFVTPAFLLLSFSNFKNKTVMCALLTVLAMALPGLLHGSNGSTQFGFRFALDYLPFLLILTASGFQRFKWSVLSKALVIFSILVNLWGITLICLFGIYTL